VCLSQLQFCNVPLSIQSPPAGSNAGDLTTQQQANALLVALMHMLLPKEIVGDDPLDEKDLDALTEVAKDNGLAAKLEQSSLPENGYGAALCLAWGVLLAAHAPPNFRSEQLHVL